MLSKCVRRGRKHSATNLVDLYPLSRWTKKVRAKHKEIAKGPVIMVRALTSFVNREPLKRECEFSVKWAMHGPLTQEHQNFKR